MALVLSLLLLLLSSAKTPIRLYMWEHARYCVTTAAQYRDLEDVLVVFVHEAHA